MAIKKYEELNRLQLDALREVGSIGSGNAASALAAFMDEKITMDIPAVQILENNAAIEQLGGPERIIAGVLIKFTGSMEGIMLHLMDINFINIILRNALATTAADYMSLTRLEISAIKEIGNIMMSAYLNAISSMTALEIKLSVPAICINMLGGILSVPMVEYGYESDKTMLIDGVINCDGETINSNLLLLPTVGSLNTLLKRLGIDSE